MTRQKAVRDTETAETHSRQSRAEQSTEHTRTHRESTAAVALSPRLIPKRKMRVFGVRRLYVDICYSRYEYTNR